MHSTRVWGGVWVVNALGSEEDGSLLVQLYHGLHMLGFGPTESTEPGSQRHLFQPLSKWKEPTGCPGSSLLSIWSHPVLAHSPLPIFYLGPGLVCSYAANKDIPVTELIYK